MTAPLQTDGFANFVLGLGAANNANRGTYTPSLYTQTDLENAYDTSTWFGKIVDIRADDATREWRSWKADREEIEDLEGLEKRLGVQAKINQAIRWADLYGGAVIIPDLPGNSASPLRPDAVNGYRMRYLTVLHRWEITAEGRIRNPLDPNYGKPERWRVPVQNGTQLILDPSRVILVNGRTHGGSATHEIWGKSLWEHMADSILASDGAAAAISALMKEAKIDVIGVEDLMDGLASDAYEAKLLKRWQLVAQLKSIANVTLIDKGDEWNTKTVQWGGLPDVVRQLLTIMAGAADIPVTRLLGTSAQGLNATGEGDLRNYYDGVKAKQDLHIGPQLAPLDELLVRSALGRDPEGIWYDWKPLWQPDEKTKWETEKLRTETYSLALATGAIDEQVLTKTYLNGSIESGLYPGIEQAIDESSEDGLVEPPDEDPSAIVAQPPAPVVADAAPRTLYVSRKLLNGTALVKWAKSVGIAEPLDASDMHVTITYSRQPVDWLKMGNSWEEELTIPKGGARLLERFDGGAVVLAFASNMLRWRHDEMRENGASFDYDEYQPHVTLTYKGADLDISAIQAYQGELKFGPEIFAEVDEDWASGRN